ncbi:MAG: hypothetical protein ACO1Q7_08995 [Gemmatimonas sp.]
MQMTYRILRTIAAAFALGSAPSLVNAQAAAYTPTMKLTEGRQIVAVYIGGENCGA